MAFPNGWSYVKGPIKYVLSTISSTCTVKARNPVTLSDDRTILEADSDSTAIYGIAAHDAADSIYAGKMLVEIPEATTVYAIKIGTSAAASEVSVGQSFDIEKSGNYLIGNEDSCGSPMVTVVPRDDFSTLDSADSTVFITILGDKLGVFGSNASVSIFAQN
jgi:hypothetical protein